MKEGAGARNGSVMSGVAHSSPARKLCGDQDSELLALHRAGL